MAFARPDLTGVQANGGGAIQDIGKDQFKVTGSLKFDLTPQWSVALLLDHPYGAGVDYKAGSIFESTVDGSTTDVRAESESLTALARYRFNEHFSVHGGLRAQQIDGAVALRGPAYGRLDGYDVLFSRDAAAGVVVGGAVELPQIAFRVALTYNGRIEHRVTTRETFRFGVVSAPPSITTITSPQSLNLDFQVALAADTLLFGSVRKACWDGFSITPAALRSASGASLVSFSNDGLTFGFGIGHRIDSRWSVVLEGGYDRPNGGTVSTLGPTDGFWSVGAGISRTLGDSTIAFGLRHVEVGDARAAVGGTVVAAFRRNHAVVAGLKLTQRF